MSVMETQYDEETVIIVSPDSTVLSVLQAAIQGIDLRDHWSLSYRCVVPIHLVATPCERLSC